MIKNIFIYLFNISINVLVLGSPRGTLGFGVRLGDARKFGVGLEKEDLGVGQAFKFWDGVKRKYWYLTILKLYPQTRFQPSLFVNEWVVCLSLQTHSLPPHSKTGQDRWLPSNHLDRITETGVRRYIYKYMKLYTQPRFQPSLFVNEWVVCLSLQTHSLPPHSKTGQDRWFPSNHLDRITETGFGDTSTNIWNFLRNPVSNPPFSSMSGWFAYLSRPIRSHHTQRPDRIDGFLPTT